MSDQQPLLRVVRGSPNDEELAALTVVLTAQAAAAATADAAKPSQPRQPWRDRAPMMRAPLYPGRDAWRASARPR